MEWWAAGAIALSRTPIIMARDGSLDVLKREVLVAGLQLDRQRLRMESILGFGVYEWQPNLGFRI